MAYSVWRFNDLCNTRGTAYLMTPLTALSSLRKPLNLKTLQSQCYTKFSRPPPFCRRHGHNLWPTRRHVTQPVITLEIISFESSFFTLSTLTPLRHRIICNAFFNHFSLNMQIKKFTLTCGPLRVHKAKSRGKQNSQVSHSVEMP